MSRRVDALAGDQGLAGRIRELEASERRMSALLALSQQFMAERDPLVLLQNVCEAARDLTHASAGGVVIVDEETRRVEHVVTVGFEPAAAAELRESMRVRERTRRVMDTRLPMRGTNPGGSPLALGLPVSHPPIHSFLLAPLASPSRVHGWVALVEKRGAATFTDDDERMVMTLGTQLALAYENLALVAELVERTRALQEHERDMEFAMSVARLGVAYRDLDSDELHVSRSLASMLELPAGTSLISRQDFLTRVHPDDAGRLQAAMAAIADGASEIELEFRVHTPTGGWRWLRSKGRVTTDHRRRKPRLFSGVTDVTESRTLELQLHQGRKMEAIGQLAGGVAHDFNNLLTAIQGYAAFLQETVTEPRQRRDVSEIVKATARATALTKRLLAFSRRQVVEAQLLDINALVEDLAEMLRRLIGEDIALVTSLKAGLPAVHTDRSELEQLVMNLVVNARDATIGGGTIHIETSLVDLQEGPPSYGLPVKEGTYVALSVTDYGRGMTEDTKNRLFEPFFTTKPRDEGTGLGLATVYGIVARSGGTISVSSELGYGSTFTVYLPAREYLPPTAPAPAEPALVTGGSETVLVVEDEAAVRFLARAILERAGYTVFEAASGDEAEEVAHTLDGLDLLLTDVVMPGRSGPDLYKRLVTVRPTLRVLFMSGYADRNLFESALLDQSQPFLEKPFTAEQLMAKVRQVLDRD